MSSPPPPPRHNHQSTHKFPKEAFPTKVQPCTLKIKLVLLERNFYTCCGNFPGTTSDSVPLRCDSVCLKLHSQSQHLYNSPCGSASKVVFKDPSDPPAGKYNGSKELLIIMSYGAEELNTLNEEKFYGGGSLGWEGLLLFLNHWLPFSPVSSQAIQQESLLLRENTFS